MEVEIKELKSVLRSLVVSSPTQMDVRSLVKDYREMMGSPLPLSKFGYRDPASFLRERCSDCFLFQGSLGNPELTLIVPETLKHIDKFVQKQRVTVSQKCKQKRRSVAAPPENLVHDSFVTKGSAHPRPASNQFPRTTASSELSLLTKSATTQAQFPNFKTRQVQSSNIENSQTQIPYSASQQTQNSSTIQAERPNCAAKKSPLPTSFKKSQPPSLITQSSAASHENYKHNYIHSEDTKAKSDCQRKYSGVSGTALQNFMRKRMPLHRDADTHSGDSGPSRRTSSSGSSSSWSRLEELKTEIGGLIEDHPDGVWCADLVGLYRKRYGRELNISRFGYTSVLSLACMLEDVLHIWRPPGAADWRLQARRVMLPHAPPSALPSAHSGAACTAPAGVSRAVPRLAPASAECATHDPDDALPGIAYDEDVFPADCMHYLESIPPPEPPQGDALEVLVGEVYSPSHLWLVRLGERYNIAMEDIMDEMNEYYERGAGRQRVLARGAVRVGQYCSSRYDGDWHRSLIVKIVDSDTVKDDVLEVMLVDTSASEDVCINIEMIRSGHAERRPDTCVGTSECYLYPSFEALESGDTPSYAEIHDYLRNGITLDCVEDYRRHVPASLPPVASTSGLSAQSPLSSPAVPIAHTLYQFDCAFTTRSSNSLFQLDSLSWAKQQLGAPRLSVVPPHQPWLLPPSPVSRHCQPANPTRCSTPTNREAHCPVTSQSNLFPQSKLSNVTLTASECEMYSRLVQMDPLAAHRYMMEAIERALVNSDVAAAQAGGSENTLTPHAAPLPTEEATSTPPTAYA
ncbi:tudor domain-containing protein 5 isoform X2 [Battus philenor]|uniref:tudor domain-containing protein 5 isoform X2 n=1 Tax=Battus philenor TaxID=42288 RepID=UPI0035CEB7E6